MNEPQPPGGILGLPVSVWIALFLGVAGVFALSQKPFQDTRPPNTMVPLHHHAIDDGQIIEARLWEDPLSAVALARNVPEKERPKPYLPANLKSNFEAYAKEAAKTLVLAVMVPGEPYSNDIEARRRERYAVLAGLYRSGFIPANSDHIGYLDADTAGISGSTPQGGAEGKTASTDNEASGDHDIAAFEWFKRDKAETGKPAQPAAGQHEGGDLTRSDRVLLLWLDQEGFRHQPLYTLSMFLKPIMGEEHELADLAVLGPADSDGLRAMYDEVASSWRSEPWQSAVRDMDFYSPRATASDQSVTNVAPDQNANLAKSLADLTKQHVRLYRAVANDKDVELAVLRELQHRGVDSFSKIALVAERDTLYARGMGSYFNGCLNPPRADTSEPSTDQGEHVACFTYLKGLDGLVPNATVPTTPDTNAPSQQQGNGSNPTSGGPGTGAPDEASGRSQLDYLRRLASTIAALRQSGKRIRAIGVISSDVYDKLLVLQALRNALPGVLYFTFDLDARMLEQKNLKWTRELIVGSSLGLSLRPELQGDIPPFRDTYQTSTFYATMLAAHRFVASGHAHAVQKAGLTKEPPADSDVSHYFYPDSMAQAGFQWITRPRVFEIGRSQEFDLGSGARERQCAFDGRCPSISPNRESWLWSTHYMWGKGLVVGLVLAALALFAAALALGVRGIVGLSRTHFIPGVGERRWSNQHNSLTFALAVTVLTALIWPYVVDDVLKNGMPTPLFGGANQWISSIIDALSIIMVVLLVVRGQRKLHDNAEWVGREFGLKMKRKKLIEWHQNRRRERRQEEEKEKAGKSAAVPDATAKPGAETRPWELPKWLVWFWFPLRALPRRSGILFAKDDVSELEAVIAQYLYHGTASARVRRVLPVTLIVVLFLVVPLEEIPGIAHLGRSFDLLSFFSLIAMQFLIFWAADALLLSRSFILALKRDQPAWPPTADTLGLPPQEATQWLDLRLVAARTRGVSGLVWYPSFVIAVMTVAALTIQFREFQFANNPIALAVGTLVVIASAVALRGAAEALRKAVKRCLENERLRAPTSPSERQRELLLERVDGLREGAFAPYSEQPIVRAVLVPAATYGATVGLQYLHLGS
jgi:Sec-independent protein translocase protein TatA